MVLKILHAQAVCHGILMCRLECPSKEKEAYLVGRSSKGKILSDTTCI